MKIKNLIESTFFNGELQGYGKHDFFWIKILKNPSIISLKGLLNKGDVRGYLTDFEEDYYFWEAKEMNHDLFETKFNMEGHGFILTKNSILFNYLILRPEEWTTNQDIIEDNKHFIDVITSSNFAKQLYPNGYKIGVSY